jgi:hypothetical protein
VRTAALPLAAWRAKAMRLKLITASCMATLMCWPRPVRSR